MSIIIRPVVFCGEESQKKVATINNSIGWKDSIEGEGFEAYSTTTKKIVGYVNLYKAEPRVWLDHLAVHNDYQSQGIGSALLQNTLATAQKEGFSSVHLLSPNSRSNDFYSSVASKLRVHYEAEESGGLQDPLGAMDFTFSFNENTPPIPQVSQITSQEKATQVANRTFFNALEEFMNFGTI